MRLRGITGGAKRRLHHQRSTWSKGGDGRHLVCWCCRKLVVVAALATIVIRLEQLPHASVLAFCPCPRTRHSAQQQQQQQQQQCGGGGGLLAYSPTLRSFPRAQGLRKQQQQRRPFGLILASKSQHRHDDDESDLPKDEEEEDKNCESSLSSCETTRRRHFLQSIVLLPSLSSIQLIGCTRPQVAQARGLIQFPITSENPLLNQYHFLASGVSLLEEQDDIWSTNPLFLTNRESALSATGQAQVQAACQPLANDNSLNLLPTVVRYSLAASASDAAVIISSALRLGTDRVIPEYTFLDPRAIGAWDMTSRLETAPILFALDHDLAGTDGTGGRPPPNSDGTPNETLADQAVRLRQLLSLLETLYSGDTILLVFPDTTGPALLSCIMANIPYNRCHIMEFTPGELRLSVTPASTYALYQSRLDDATFMSNYQATLERGRVQLQQLGYYDYANEESNNQESSSSSSSSSSTASADTIKDEEKNTSDGEPTANAEPATTAAPSTPTTTMETDGSQTDSAVDDATAPPTPPAAPTTLVNKKDAKIEAERLEVERKYAQEQAVKNKLQVERDESLRQERLALIQQQRLEEAQRQQQQQQQLEYTSSPISPQLLGGVAVLGALAAAQNALSPGNKNNNNLDESSGSTSSRSSTNTMPVVVQDIISDARTTSTTTTRGRRDANVAPTVDMSTTPYSDTNRDSNQEEMVVSNIVNSRGSSSSSSLYGGSSSSSSWSASSLQVPTETDRLDAAVKAMENYLNQDDGAQDWLSSLTEIIEEEEEDGNYDDSNGSPSANDEKDPVPRMGKE